MCGIRGQRRAVVVFPLGRYGVHAVLHLTHGDSGEPEIDVPEIRRQ